MKLDIYEDLMSGDIGGWGGDRNLGDGKSWKTLRVERSG